LDIFEQNDILGENVKKSHYIKSKLEKFTVLKNVKEIRQQGMVTAIELKGYQASERVGLKVYEYALDQGVLLRPLGHVIYFMPPYIISYEEIDKMIEVAFKGIKKVIK
jgi:adenosylmethionine-8-amino-7-oxononanoate aminotransferase